LFLSHVDIPGQDLLDFRIAPPDQIRPAALDNGADFSREKIADIGVRLSRVIFGHGSTPALGPKLASRQDVPARLEQSI
jgi:hypothetical protein